MGRVSKSELLFMVSVVKDQQVQKSYEFGWVIYISVFFLPEKDKGRKERGCKRSLKCPWQRYRDTQTLSTKVRV